MRARVGVIFDLDNTLIQSDIDFHGMADALINYVVETSGQSSCRDSLGNRTIAEIIEASRELVPGRDITTSMWEIVAQYEAQGMVDLTLEEGAPEAIRALHHEGHRLAICTNNAHIATKEALVQFGDPHPFDPVITRDEVRALKPSPEGLIAIIDTWRPMGVRQFVFVGDSWLDGKAAENAGIPFIEYRGGPSRVKREPIPVYRKINFLSDLPAIVNDLQHGR